MAYRKIISAILEGKPIDIYGDGLQKRTNTYVEDIVDATVVASKEIFSGDIYNIGGSQSIKLLEAIQTIETMTGNRVEKTSTPHELVIKLKRLRITAKPKRFSTFFLRLRFKKA
jgi:nucleoside-diphosphate-sugar epimerase